MSVDITFKTPQQFIDYYGDECKKYLGQYDIQVNKAGFIGFLINILGWTSFDVRNYFDYLFKEGFVATAATDENLYLHSSIYGYNPTYATAAKATGFITLDMSLLPTPVTGVVKREVTLLTSEGISFKVDDLNFTTSSTYKFINKNSNYFSSIIDANGNSYQIASPTYIIQAPFYDVYQYSQEEFTVQLPPYLYGSYYPYEFAISSDSYLYDIDVYVTRKDSSVEEKFEIKTVKFTEDAFSRTVFIKRLSSQSIVLEFGSGLKGEWLPNATIRIVAKTTNGLTGNIQNDASFQLESPKQFVVVDTFADDTLSNPTVYSTARYFKAQFQYSENGSNPISGDNLRKELINYIQTRDNLISERDYYNVSNKYVNDFKFLFKKITVFDNNFYVCRALRDEYQTVIRATNHSVLEDHEMFDGFDYVYKPEFTIDSLTFVSPFLYKFNTFMDWYEGFHVNSSIQSRFSEYIHDDLTYTYESPPLFLTIVYDPETVTTTLSVKSHQDLEDFTIKLTIYELELDNVTLTPLTEDESTLEHFYEFESPTYDNGLIWAEEFKVKVNVYDSNTSELLFHCISNPITQVYNTSDQIILSKYTDVESDDRYIVNIPVMLKSTYESNMEYFDAKLKEFIIGINFQENRFPNDNVQFRFLNTHLIDETYLDVILKQDYSFDLKFPLKLYLSITVDIDYIRDNSINLSNEKYVIQMETAEYFQDKYTGVDISFYKAKVTELIMKYPYVKSVVVTIKDSSSTQNTVTNLETNTDSDILKALVSDKFSAVKYLPPYFYWDLDDISVTLVQT